MMRSSFKHIWLIVKTFSSEHSFRGEFLQKLYVDGLVVVLVVVIMWKGDNTMVNCKIVIYQVIEFVIHVINRCH